eukprot:1466046-Heterocapsa_arctica.AAC.1
MIWRPSPGRRERHCRVSPLRGAWSANTHYQASVRVRLRNGVPQQPGSVRRPPPSCKRAPTVRC